MLTVNVTNVSTVRRPYDPVVCDPTPVGDTVVPVLRLKRDENGNCIYVKVGEKNLNEYISSFKNGCALASILDRINLMPVNDKIRYLQQTDNGVSADLSSMPTDGTEAFIMVQKLGRQYPQIFERVAKGETLDTVLNDIFKPKTDSTELIVEPTKKGSEE